MFKKEYFKRVAVPAILFSFVLVLSDMPVLYSEFFAYVTCYAFVFLREKKQESLYGKWKDAGVWLNYAVWAFILAK